MLVLDKCHACGDVFAPSDEDDDLCYRCRTSPVLEDDGSATCLNCGRPFPSSDGVGSFCSGLCAHVGYRDIVSYGRRD